MSSTKESLLAFLAPREERITFAGTALVVREINNETDAAAFVDSADSLYKFIVRCVLTEKGERVFTDDDIPALKATGRMRLKKLADPVMRVMGLDVDNEIKNSDAGPTPG